MKKVLAAAAAALAMGAVAHAAPMTVGGVDFDTDNAATDVLWAQGGVFAGLTTNLREACADPTDPTSTVGPSGTISCRADEAAGFNLDEFVQLTETNPGMVPPDVLAVFFDQPLVNGMGDDLIIFEEANQSDMPTVSLFLAGMEILGTVLDTVTIDGKKYTISGFDFSDAPISLAMGAVIGQPIYIRTFGPDGSADISAIIGRNFGMDPVVPLPAAWPLFFAGLAGLGFARRLRSRNA